LVYEYPVSIGLTGKIENGNALRLLLILTKRSKVFEKNSNSSYYFPLPLHSKKTAGEIRQSSFRGTGNSQLVLYAQLLQKSIYTVKVINSRPKTQIPKTKSYSAILLGIWDFKFESWCLTNREI